MSCMLRACVHMHPCGTSGPASSIRARRRHVGRSRARQVRSSTTIARRPGLANTQYTRCISTDKNNHQYMNNKFANVHVSSTVIFCSGCTSTVFAVLLQPPPRHFDVARHTSCTVRFRGSTKLKQHFRCCTEKQPWRTLTLVRLLSLIILSVTHSKLERLAVSFPVLLRQHP